MANLIIKPAAVGDDFKMQDAGSNVILTVEGQTDSGVAAAGRIIYGKGVNETLGTDSYDAATDVVTIDLATGTFFDVVMTGTILKWQILHLPASGTIAAWVVRLQNGASAYVNTWAAITSGTGSCTWDNGGTWSDTLPLFHWAGDDHVLTTAVNAVDILTFWTSGGATPTIYCTISGQEFD